MLRALSKQTHTHKHTRKASHQYVPTTCEGTYTSINLPFFSLSFPLSSWESSVGAFTSKPNIDRIPQTPPRHPPSPPSLPGLLLSPPSASHSLVLFGLCLRKERAAGLCEKFKKKKAWQREGVIPEQRRRGKMDEGEKRRLGKKGNYDCKEGSSAKADGCRVRDGTTMERLLVLFHRPPPLSDGVFDVWLQIYCDMFFIQQTLWTKEIVLSRISSCLFVVSWTEMDRDRDLFIGGERLRWWQASQQEKVAFLALSKKCPNAWNRDWLQMKYWESISWMKRTRSSVIMDHEFAVQKHGEELRSRKTEGGGELLQYRSHQT